MAFQKSHATKLYAVVVTTDYGREVKTYWATKEGSYPQAMKDFIEYHKPKAWLTDQRNETYRNRSICVNEIDTSKGVEVNA